jgi:hypothetical protein
MMNVNCQQIIVDYIFSFIGSYRKMDRLAWQAAPNDEKPKKTVSACKEARNGLNDTYEG